MSCVALSTPASFDDGVISVLMLFRCVLLVEHTALLLAHGAVKRLQESSCFYLHHSALLLRSNPVSALDEHSLVRCHEMRVGLG